ncbi:KpsF/GutQ family sugar-phosphate isomerase [Oligella urethralis]|uniref:KpsF/GutQ family sugar-phosphate isomerase n=1 Tax=Oligella urethralis TaxID=90245 RepID=UPI000CFE7EEC|nr:KpsF/GutQ family sugar-phosphate isomerase [Oligella urethralis]AVL71688.1 D-arabinose 5-phosphate isomerase [Oligella urethralis]MDK6202467.1 KpsF/GutQ family sugar-phosphate isomerase [Oligella urethralis]
MDNKKSFDPALILATGQQTVFAEAEALTQLGQRLGDDFVAAAQLILACQGRVVVMGIGKSGHIGRKIAATLASTGTPAFFVHSAEALHGDLGMVTGSDIVLAISYSGQSIELSTSLPVVKRLGTKIIAISGDAQSDLAKLADVYLDGAIEREACPLNLAPTNSTTVALALGDALAIACLQAREFGAADFALSHPGGALGRRLLTHVQDVMRSGEDLPIITPEHLVPEALEVMSAKHLGMTIIIDSQHKPIGIFTDGDLRRLIVREGDIRNLKIKDVMSHHPKTIHFKALAVDAATLMEQNKLSQIIVIDDDGALVGALNMHNLMSAKVI